ncbi:hypothetical protein J8273_7075 [Carpediemonas membranifera]|uniref:SAPS-domain-containing protein n=1 Tax=Carpediemonas membranifera TaxID=201153 RepID=A0A8J6BUX5_9EUKA|nr:hypothetical protein J8273_7075 [Carpediemonas membranifera]|eukprot:KAG9390816.1 hypothetical protein J8273_7075 [Carpediemonas membranifera]
MSFWSEYSYALPVSNLNTLLDRDDITLDELMNEDDFLGTCKSIGDYTNNDAHNRKLAEMLMDPANTTALLHHLLHTEPPKESSAIRVRNLGDVASELIRMELGPITHALTAPPHQWLAAFFKGFLEILEQEVPEDQELSRMRRVQRTVQAAEGLRDGMAEVLEFLDENPEVLKSLARHIKYSAVDEFFCLLTTEETASAANLPRALHLLSAGPMQIWVDMVLEATSDSPDDVLCDMQQPSDTYTNILGFFYRVLCLRDPIVRNRPHPAALIFAASLDRHIPALIKKFVDPATPVSLVRDLSTLISAAIMRHVPDSKPTHQPSYFPEGLEDESTEEEDSDSGTGTVEIHAPDTTVLGLPAKLSHSVPIHLALVDALPAMAEALKISQDSDKVGLRRLTLVQFIAALLSNNTQAEASRRADDGEPTFVGLRPNLPADLARDKDRPTLPREARAIFVKLLIEAGFVSKVIDAILYYPDNTTFGVASETILLSVLNSGSELVSVPGGREVPGSLYPVLGCSLLPRIENCFKGVPDLFAYWDNPPTHVQLVSIAVAFNKALHSTAMTSTVAQVGLDLAKWDTFVADVVDRKASALELSNEAKQVANEVRTRQMNEYADYTSFTLKTDVKLSDSPLGVPMDSPVAPSLPSGQVMPSELEPPYEDTSFFVEMEGKALTEEDDMVRFEDFQDEGARE